jgi:replicative DNA helicase
MRNNLSPQDLNLETALLGAILIQPHVLSEILQTGLTAQDFYKDSNRLVFEACNTLQTEGKPIDLITVRSELERTKTLEAVGGAFALVTLTTEVSSSSHAVSHAARLKEIGIKNRLHDFVSIMYQRTSDPSTDVFELLEEFKAISDQSVPNQNLKGINLKEAALTSLLDGNKERVERLENGFTGITGVPTFSKELDLMLQGKHRKKLDVYGAFTGNGKSLQMVACAYNAAKAGYNSVIISLEMGESELADRFLSIESGISYSRITKKMYSDREFDILLMHHEKVAEILERVKIYTVSNLDIRKVENIIYKEKQAHTFYIDYIQLVAFDSKKQKNEGLGIYTKQLKELSMKYDINVTVLAQLNREVMNIKTKEDLHERFIGDSKQIADDADNIILSMVYQKFGVLENEFGESTKKEYESLVGFNLVKQRGGASHAWDMWVNLGQCIYKDNEVKIKDMQDAILDEIKQRDIPQDKLNNSDVPF